MFPAPEGGYLNLANWRTREWYPALVAAGIAQRGPYRRHTFATEALAGGLSIFQMARVMGASVKTIDRHYGHLAHDRSKPPSAPCWTLARTLRLVGRGKIVLASTWRCQGGADWPWNAKTPAGAGVSGDGSDGTRTRDLRRDRPAF